MGSPTTVDVHIELECALSAGAYRRACRLAAAVDDLDPIDSLRLTVLAAQRDPGRFDRMARDWITEAIAGGALGLGDLSWFVPMMHAAGEGRRTSGERLLLLMRHRRPQ